MAIPVLDHCSLNFSLVGCSCRPSPSPLGFPKAVVLSSWLKVCWRQTSFCKAYKEILSPAWSALIRGLRRRCGFQSKTASSFVDCDQTYPAKVPNVAAYEWGISELIESFPNDAINSGMGLGWFAINTLP